MSRGDWLRFLRPSPTPMDPARRATLWTIVALVALGPFTVTVYQPALPSIAASLATTPDKVQLTLASYFATFAGGQLVYGPLSDHFGRRKVLLAGLAIFAAGSLICMLASDIGMLIAARAIQGFGACAGPALGRAMVRDVYGAKGTQKAMAFVSSGLAIAPGIAPILGGYIAGSVGWQALFGILAAVAAGLFLMVLFRAGETSAYVGTGRMRFAPFVTSYATLLRDRLFLGYALMVAAAAAGNLGFWATAPFLITGRLGYSAEAMGWLFTLPLVAYFLTTLVVTPLAGRLPLARMMTIGATLMVTGASLHFAAALLGWLSIATVMGPQLVWMAGFAFVVPSAMAGGITPFPAIAGAAAALQGFFMQGTGAVASLGLSQLPVGLLPFSTMTVIASIAATAFFVRAVVMRPGDPEG